MTVANLKFVDNPATTATTRLDLQSATTATSTRVLHADYDLGAPDLAGDPDSVGAQWGFRTITLRVMVDGTRANALPVLAAIAREVTQRPTNWLMFQLGTDTIPVWFKTYRTTPGAVSLEHVSADTSTRDQWEVEVKLDAEPFAYGALTSIAAQTITNDPWTGTNPCVYTLPTIKGDAPAPVILQATTSVEWSGFSPLFSMVAYDPTLLTSGLGALAQGRRLDTITAGTDTGAYVTATGYVGGGYREVSFATTASAGSLIPRLQGALATALQPGRYKVLVWAYRTDTSSTFTFQLAQSEGSGVWATGNPVPFDRAAGYSNNWQAGWVDLGDFQFPVGGDLNDNLTVGAAPTIGLNIARTSGTGKMRVSALMFVPVDMPATVQVTTFTAQFGYWGLQTDETAEWNGETEQFTRLATSGLPSTRTARESETPPMSGDYLQVVPDSTNLLVMLQQTNVRTPANKTDNNGDIPTNTATVAMSYYPRYLWLADA